MENPIGAVIKQSIVEILAAHAGSLVPVLNLPDQMQKVGPHRMIAGDDNGLEFVEQMAEVDQFFQADTASFYPDDGVVGKGSSVPKILDDVRIRGV